MPEPDVHVPNAQSPTITVNAVNGCARCGGVHENVQFALLSNPVLERTFFPAPAYTHWAPCPMNGEPILLLIAAEVK